MRVLNVGDKDPCPPSHKMEDEGLVKVDIKLWWFKI